MNICNEILTAAGVNNRETRFTKPQHGTYAVWNEDVDTDGPDYVNAIITNDYTIELYEDVPDPDSEAAIEAQFDARGIRWRKQARYWIQSEQLYQVIYEFSQIIKKEI